MALVIGFLWWALEGQAICYANTGSLQPGRKADTSSSTLPGPGAHNIRFTVRLRESCVEERPTTFSERHTRHRCPTRTIDRQASEDSRLECRLVERKFPI